MDWALSSHSEELVRAVCRNALLLGLIGGLVSFRWPTAQLVFGPLVALSVLLAARHFLPSEGRSPAGNAYAWDGFLSMVRAEAGGILLVVAGGLGGVRRRSRHRGSPVHERP